MPVNNSIAKGSLQKKKSKTLDICQTEGEGPAGSDVQTSLFDVQKSENNESFSKVTPLIWASEGQNNESNQIRSPKYPGGGVSGGLANVQTFALFLF